VTQSHTHTLGYCIYVQCLYEYREWCIDIRCLVIMRELYEKIILSSKLNNTLQIGTEWGQCWVLLLASDGAEQLAVGDVRKLNGCGVVAGQEVCPLCLFVWVCMSALYMCVSSVCGCPLCVCVCPLCVCTLCLCPLRVCPLCACALCV